MVNVYCPKRGIIIMAISGPGSSSFHPSRISEARGGDPKSQVQADIAAYKQALENYNQGMGQGEKSHELFEDLNTASSKLTYDLQQLSPFPTNVLPLYENLAMNRGQMWQLLPGVETKDPNAESKTAALTEMTMIVLDEMSTVVG